MCVVWCDCVGSVTMMGGGCVCETGRLYMCVSEHMRASAVRGTVGARARKGRCGGVREHSGVHGCKGGQDTNIIYIWPV